MLEQIVSPEFMGQLGYAGSGSGGGGGSLGVSSMTEDEINAILTESEQTIKAYEAEQSITGKKKKAGKGAKPEVTDNTRNKEDFEAMKRKTKGILIGMIAAVVAAVAGVVAYKATH